jgi:ATP-dependent RNA helicase DHR2
MRTYNLQAGAETNIQKDIRKQLRSHCQNNKILKSPAELDYVKELDPERANLILQCFVEAYSSHTARIMPDGSYKTLIGNQTVAIHPSSVLFGRKFEAIMYHEYIYTTKSYAKNVSAVQLVWVDEVMARDVAQS